MGNRAPAERPASIVALAGGVGGAKLAGGLQAVLAPGALSVVGNTADDFKLWGMHISPDLDTVMYTLAGVANPTTGWGLRDETWHSLGMMACYGADTWFRIGDRDLATHLLRTHLLAEGQTLSGVTARLASALGVPSRILPMCDEPVATIVQTPHGELDFQSYFVRRKHSDPVSGIVFKGADQAKPTPEVRAALAEASAIIFCPSNPIVSIGPILAVPGLKESIRDSSAVKVAVSPIVGGAALKGPAADMLSSLGHEVSAAGVAAIYAPLIDGMVIDRTDEALAPRIEQLGIAAQVEDTIMNNEADRAKLAEKVLDFCERLAGSVTG